MSTQKEVLKQYWGYDQFRPFQERIIHSVLEGKDTLALLPTGGGKSICFQVPTMMKEGLCLVVSPLIALMKDQVQQLKSRGISAVAVYSGMHRREIDIVLDNCVYGNIKFLYCSPERLKTALFRERLLKMNISLIAVDEAHCISQWGYAFRPTYLEIAQLRELFPETNILALTATATHDVKEDIIKQLLFKDQEVFQGSFLRDNLSYSAFKEENKLNRILKIFEKVQGSALIYTRSRKRTQEVVKFLQENGISADFYHAGLSSSQRSFKQDAWIGDSIRVMVATNAFGMGIDKAEVRLVIHLDVPDHLEAYYQEAGRAGRDGERAYAVLLYHPNDFALVQRRLEMAHPSIEYIARIYQSLSNYYKLAIGSDLLTSHDFDLVDFTKKFNLKTSEAFYGIKKLEEEGLIQLNESYHSPSRLYIKIDKGSLYDFQIANPRFDDFIKLLLRMYGGELYNNFISISESKLASNLILTVPEVESLLSSLNEMDYVIYEKQKDKPQIVFLGERQSATKLPIDIQKYELRKRNAFNKFKSIEHFASQQRQCRARTLVEYFGEVTTKDCGICDVCQFLRNQLRASTQYDKHKNEILKSLNGRQLSLDDLIHQNKPENLVGYTNTIREMLDAGELAYTTDGRLQVKP